MGQKLIALVELNSAYCEMERLFRPDLKGRAIVVLSSSDGCVVSRSAEAKKLGVKMGEVYFKIREWYEHQGGVAFSSNFTLYGDLSARFMAILSTMTYQCVPYSVDEAWVTIDTAWAGDPTEYGRAIRAKVLQWIGLSSGVGIGPTKVIAKLASAASKRWPKTGGVVDLSDPARLAKLMAITPVDEVWGIGRKLSAKLVDQGIRTAADLAAADPKILRRRYGVLVERTALELRGIPCAGLEEMVKCRQQVIVSRTFGERISNRDVMRQSLAVFIELATEKLRREGVCCQHISIFMQTSMFDTKGPQYANQASTGLVVPTDDPRVLLATLEPLLTGTWRDGYPFSKAGIMLSDIQPKGLRQGDLFAADHIDPRREALMNVVDAINHSGKLGKVYFAARGHRDLSSMIKRERLSPRYTTNLAELPVVKA
ncbi:translesion error-prone DNA polymerase V subunit UmuC (plasmid) [Aeromonas caviae]|nr:translesion error-prone DNA polymerase V subunit UmuC [Aeromonas caviae]